MTTAAEPGTPAEPASPGARLKAEVRAYLALCQEAFELASREREALAETTLYQPLEFNRQRKDLLPRLEQSLMVLREWRLRGQPAEPSEGSELRSLFQAVSGVLMKLLLLDRENQQALLRRGVLPAGPVPAMTLHQPQQAAALYRRHSRA